MSLIGVHIKHIDDIVNVRKYYKNINLIQIFVSAMTNYNDEKYKHVLKYIKIKKIKIVVHSSYSINLSKRWDETSWWIQQFIKEIECSNQLGALGIVIHIGKQLEMTISEALNNMYTSLLYVHYKTRTLQKIKIIIETSSGQGTEILTQIQELCKFMKKIYTHPDENVRNRFGICIDSCHVFAAGNDIRTKQDMKIFFRYIHRSIGIDKIKLCHINDSKKGLGKNVDRHMNIGEGYLGKDTLRRIIKFMKKLIIPIVLETPELLIREDYKFLKNI